MTWEQASSYVDYATNNGDYGNIPDWLLATRKALDTMPGDNQPWWEAVAAGMAAMNLMQDADSVEPLNYVTTYPVLSAQLAKVQSYGNKTILDDDRKAANARAAFLVVPGVLHGGRWMRERVMPVCALVGGLFDSEIGGHTALSRRACARGRGRFPVEKNA